MEVVTMDRRICLESKFLDNNIMTHLFERLKEYTDKDCTKSNGHILKVRRIIKIVDDCIANTSSDIVFTVRFEAETLLPEAGKKLSGIVCMVYGGGLFIEIMGRQKLLISKDELSEFVFDEENKTFSKGKRVIKEGDTVDAIITASQYSKKNFNCFGKLIL